MADEMVVVSDVRSAVGSYLRFMEDLTKWINGAEVSLFQQHVGSTFTGKLQNEAGAKLGVLKLFVEQLKVSNPEIHAELRAQDDLAALINDMVATRKVVADEMERLDAAFLVWIKQLRTLRNGLDSDLMDVRSNRRVRAPIIARRASPRPIEVNFPDETEDEESGGSGGENAEEYVDSDVQSALGFYKRKRNEEDADDGEDSESATASVVENTGDLEQDANEAETDDADK